MPSVSAKSWVFRGLAALISLGVTLLLLEGGLRVLYARDQARGGDLQKRLERSRQTALGSTQGSFNMAGLVQPSPHADVVYMLKPGLRGDVRGKQMAINQAGLRGPEVQTAMPVMVTGGIRRRATAEDALAPEDGRAGVAMIGVAQILAYAPDLVIVHFISNDLGLPLFMENPPDPLAWGESRLLDLVRKRQAWARGDVAGFLEVRKSGEMTPDEMRRVSGPYQHMAGAAGFRAAMERLARATGNAPPRAGEPSRRRVPVVLLRGSFSPGQGGLLDETIQRYGFVSLDIGPVTERRMRELGYPDDPAAQAKALRIGPGDSHPNELGHIIYADGLMDVLVAEGVIGPASG